mmetsp:Transcript_6141/g.18365  ORF Transcript_6141/g.18365 Transcript_6141/m.18365 type:complete len:231 (+) Transcript_6141:1129-1821(+)
MALQRLPVALRQVIAVVQHLHGVDREVLVVEERELLERREVPRQALPRHRQRGADLQPPHLRHDHYVHEGVVGLAEKLRPHVQLQLCETATVSVEKREDRLLSLRALAGAGDLQRLELRQHKLWKEQLHGAILKPKDLQAPEVVEAAAQEARKAGEHLHLLAVRVVPVARVHQGQRLQLREEVRDHLGPKCPLVGLRGARRQLWQAQREGARLVQQEPADGAARALSYAL